MGDLEKFNKILIDIFSIGENEVRDDATPEDIEDWDSVTHMDLVAQFEEAFDINFDVEEITEMETIGIMKEVLRKHGVKI